MENLNNESTHSSQHSHQSGFDLSKVKENQWASYVHLSSLAGFIIPFGNIIGPLVIWAMKKDEFKEVDYHGKEAINFQITATIGFIIGSILTFIFIGIFVVLAILVADVIFTIQAFMAANKGERYKYPYSYKFIQ